MKDMTTGKPLRLIISFALPLLLGNLLQQFYNVADAAIVGRFLGADALAAVGATTSVQFLILGFCTGTCSGFCIPMAQKFGAKDYSSLRKLFYHSILLVIAGAFIFTVSCALLTPQILRILSTPDNIRNDTYAYILVIFLGIPFTLLYNLCAGVLRAVGDSKTPFMFLAFSTIANIFLDLFCIAVLGWGCAGAAIATIASQAACGIGCAWFIYKKFQFLHFSKEERQFRPDLCRTLVVMGFPMGIQFSITAIGSMFMQSANNGLGSIYVSAFTVGSRIKMFAMCPIDAIAAAAATFCGQNYGAGRSDRIRTGYRIGAITGGVYGAFIGAVIIFFGRTSCLLFLKPTDTAILNAASQLLRMEGYWFWILGLLNVNRITVQGLGFSGRAMVSGAIEMAARTGVSLFLVPRYGFWAICIADQTAWILADCYIIPMCIHVLKKIDRQLGQVNARPSIRHAKKVSVGATA